MSKAFTRESDDSPEQPVPARQSSILPLGVKNYMTPDGVQRLRDELDRLLQVERPRISAADGDAKRQLQLMDLRIEELQQSLQSAEVVPPPDGAANEVRFGATVTVRERNGEEVSYRIVGVSESDPDRGWVSWLSPIARALLNARLGERVRFKFPAGEEELEIVKIAYE